MRGFLTTLAPGLALAIAGFAAPSFAQDDAPRWSLAIHGGAGTIARENMTAEEDAAYRASLQAALDAGARVLAEGGEALDAVEAVILLLEEDPRFNAGRGAVYTWEGGHELDASIMDGRDRDAGAVAGVTTIRHPILLARKVMTDSPHVMLAGEGAEEFAAEQGIEFVPPEFFDTDARRQSLERMKAEKLSAIDVDVKFGTVGAVALDTQGNLAAGTSTGGMTGKRWRRIGDAPVIGAGTYADNRACAVSATGWGEYFIRVGVARTICARMQMGGESAQAASDAVMDDVKALGGDGGVIVVSPTGDAVFSFNTAGMYRGRATSGGTSEVAIYGEE
ncbi:isoaspartyl peptidase/L-asparaginase [Qipengyuania flava]|nr:isoaspartyl peptidase/L-asparaginase [Qipengyuania flava]